MGNKYNKAKKLKDSTILNKRGKNHKMRSNLIFSLLDKFSVNEIENSLIYLYLEKLNKTNVKNRLIKERLKKINPKTTEFLFDSLKNNNIDLTFKNIEKICELLIEEKDRQINGAFYTPDSIVDKINEEIIEKNNPNFKVCDPSCGSGAFLIRALEKISKENKKKVIDTIEENIYGVDIMPHSVERTKIMLSLFALENNEDKEEISFRIFVGDSLNSESFNWKAKFPEVFIEGGFNGIIGNPPYVRIQDFNKDLKSFLISKYKTTNKGNFNLYFAFFELGIKLLNENGRLGYITPNNYFTSLAAKELRSYLQEKRLIEKIISFNHLRVFEDATTYTCITFLNKKEKSEFSFINLNNLNDLGNLRNLKLSNVGFEELDNKKWRLMDELDIINIKKIETVGTPLGKFANIKVGIATLKDALYFVDGNKQRGEYYLKDNKGKEFLIEKEATRKVIKIASVDSEDELKLDNRRIIFPYSKRDNNHYLILENEFKSKFPKCYEYLVSVKEDLASRDKGKNKIPAWYAYGRAQGLNLYGKKLLTKTFSNKPNFMFDEDEYSLFCNGYAVFLKDQNDFEILKKILNSKIMDYYAKKTSVEIEGDYQCYQKNFIESFSVPQLDKNQKNFILNEMDKNVIDRFLIKIYGLTLTNSLTL